MRVRGKLGLLPPSRHLVEVSQDLAQHHGLRRLLQASELNNSLMPVSYRRRQLLFQPLPLVEHSPDGTRRPHWLIRPVKPTKEAYKLPAEK